MDNKEVYTNIVNSIEALNKGLQLQDTRTVKLFSYMYNEHLVLADKVKELEPTNQDIQLLSYCIVNLDQRMQKLDNKINKIDKKIDKVILSLNDLNNKKIDIPKEKVKKDNKFKKSINDFWNNICIKTKPILEKIANFFKKIWQKIYNIIFYYQIKKKKEEEKLKKEEEEKRKKELRNQQIKNILNRK